MQPTSFFSSMLPPNATSFVPQDPNQLQNIAGIGDGGAGFTSPGMNPQGYRR